MMLRSIAAGNDQPNYTVSWPRRPKSQLQQLWKPLSIIWRVVRQKYVKQKCLNTKVKTLAIPTDLIHAITFCIYTRSHFHEYKPWFELHCLWLVGDWWRAKN